MKIQLSELRRLIRTVLQESQAPDDGAHIEFAKAITNEVNNTHFTEDTESVMGGSSVDVDAIESNLRNSKYFQIGNVEYKWEEIRNKVLEELQKDYREKINLASKLIDKLQTNPSLGEKDA
jgi:hypothetical protein